MPRWEVCYIEQNSRVEHGFLSKRAFSSWKAVADTLNGKQIVEQTPEWEQLDTMDKRRGVEYEKAKHFRSVLVGRLLASGWEPIDGTVTTFRRLVP